jgi:hypothetical protein
VVLVLMLAVVPVALASHVPGHDATGVVPVANEVTQQAASKFLSAEAQRLIKDEFAIVKADLETYQDENFIALDGEMRATMSRVQQQVILGSLGVMLLGGSIIAIIMFNIAKKYSYEKFLEDQLANPNFQQNFEQEGAELGNLYQDSGVQQMQQKDWGYPDQTATLSQDQGQSFASNNSEFSGWQQQPPHKEGWEWNGGGKKQ